MFYYFGYGSNMSITSLKAKGVEPLSAEPAVLDGWKLSFNIPDFFLIEGGTGNISMDANHQVHGILYSCRDEHLKVLDELEAIGVNYKRLKFMVVTYTGRTVSAYAYVGIEERLKEGYQPSRRYLNILIRGAEQMTLNPDYINVLKSIEVKTDPVNRPFHFPPRPARIFSKEDLKTYPLHTAIAGAVFDMSHARPDHQYLQDFFKGKDMTLFFLKRMDSSDGTESFEDIYKGRISNEQRRYLTNYLHEFDREYRFVGKMDYQLDLKRKPRISDKVEIKPSEKASSHAVIENAEKMNRFLGHENLGFLSFSHGFMPLHHPQKKMPADFQPWDDLIRRLPDLYGNLQLRKEIRNLPILQASEERLSDAYLLRAGAILAMLAHAYAYVETDGPQDPPPSITQPWTDVRRRLGRDQEVLSYIDLIVYNWRLRQADAANPFRVENMALLMPTVNNKEEQNFYLTQTEILAQCAPIIGAIARGQEALKTDSRSVLEDELVTILKCLKHVVQVSLLKINPNPVSSSHVDPVIWAKTVAPFAVPLKPGVQGPSGTSSPIFNLMDTFFGRQKHETFLGKEIKSLRSGYPPFWQDFLEAVASTSVPEYIRSSDDPNLQALLREAFELYAGPNGFLGRHRLKVYGYLEIAFKVGRSVTIGGFSGLFKDRTWDQVDSELEYSRLERQESFPSSCHYGYIKAVGQTHHSGPENVKHVVIDVSGAGIHYRPGDRCGILPENSDQLIERTLAALGANGSESIRLTEEWIKAAHLRHGFAQSHTLSLRDFLRFAKIRPVVPRLAEALHAISQNKALAQAIKGQTTSRWELWDLLIFLRSEGFDPSRLWTSDYHSPMYIARVVPPEQFRMYSISSALESGEAATEIHLTIGRLRYQSDGKSGESDVERLGTASNFLATSHGRKAPLSITIDHPPRFSLPEDHTTPIIMIAGGTGFAPFRSFIARRMQQKESGPCWILLSLQSRDFFYYQDDLLPGLASGMIKLDTLFSQEDARPVFQKLSANHGTFTYHESPRGHIQDLLLDKANAAQLWRMLQSPEEGGQGAYLYICGRTRFAKSIHNALKTAFSDFFEGNIDQRMAASHESLCRIAAEGRFMQEIFTHARSWDTDRKAYNISDVVDRNSEDQGYWMIIDGVVYDVTDFIGLHPGGHSVLVNYCGLDATQGFMRVHQGHSEIEAMRDMYEIGVVRQLDFKGASRTVSLRGAQSVVGLSALYRKWIDILYLVVEMENAQNLDQSLQTSQATLGDTATDRSLYKVQRSIETHQRFIQSYAHELGGRPFIEIWELTSGMASTGSEQLWMQDVIMAIHEGLDAKFPVALSSAMQTLLAELIDQSSTADDPRRQTLNLACTQIESMDKRLLLTIKKGLKRGIEIFERFQSRTLEEGGQGLLAELRQFPTAFETYYREARNFFHEMGWKREHDGNLLDIRPWQPEKINVLMTDIYWTFEEHPLEKIVILRRTPTPVNAIAELIASNERIISLMQTQYVSYGVIVDMRQASQRNDPDFENAMLKLRLAVATSFARVAVLLESATGVLQVNRIGRNDGAETFATMNEFAAVKFARGAA
ncbi:MAG TPA: cytochrome b5 domain-containing protein [Oligoflexus sp.]|uniref:cytochrome b5 domain-containing protein n=1 Tax=Oligoflexus sp. TaxID=1971216 RepID=UPI002D36B035|nr:cytochrome b5 domain-containing protein [Oligoflexus sp.]HYX34220.1 cytochrome b5 domain-containing protein [Oligoflexus sp.]